MLKYFVTLLISVIVKCSIGGVKYPNAGCPCDSLPQFSVHKLVTPFSMITCGIAAHNYQKSANAFNHFPEYVLCDKLGDRPTRIDDAIQYLPIVAFVSIPGKYKFTDKLFLAATASLAAVSMIQPLKQIVTETRPNGSGNNSFPSGHTTTAFLGAELLRLSGYGKQYYIPAYCVAFCVACLRIHNQRHYFNDVVAGAGFGILSANIAHWLYPLEKRCFSKRKAKRAEIQALSNY